MAHREGWRMHTKYERALTISSDLRPFIHGPPQRLSPTNALDSYSSLRRAASRITMQAFPSRRLRAGIATLAIDGHKRACTAHQDRVRIGPEEVDEALI